MNSKVAIALSIIASTSSGSNIIQHTTISNFNKDIIDIGVIRDIQYGGSYKNTYSNTVTHYLSKTNIERGINMGVDLTNNIAKISAFIDVDTDDFIGVEKKLANRIISFISELDQQPEVFITGDGSVQLEYGNVRNKYLEFTIMPDNTMDFFVIDKNGNEKEICNLDCNLDFIKKEVALYNGKFI